MPASRFMLGIARAARLLAVGARTPSPPPPRRCPESNLCADPAGPVALGSAQWNGWGRDLENTRYQPEPAIRATDVPKLALKWAFGYQGSAVSGQPTIVDGRVFVDERNRPGVCARCKDAAAPIGPTTPRPAFARAISIGELAAAEKARRRPNANPNASSPWRTSTCRRRRARRSSATTRARCTRSMPKKARCCGRRRSMRHPMARIQAAPTLYQNRLYVAVASNEPSAAARSTYSCCTFRGSVAALDIANGHVLWKTYTVPEEPRPYRKSGTGVQEFGPAGVPVSGSHRPSTPSAAWSMWPPATRTPRSISRWPMSIVAFDLDDGKLRWAKQPARQEQRRSRVRLGSPILRTLASGKQVILAGQRSGHRLRSRSRSRRRGALASQR